MKRKAMNESWVLIKNYKMNRSDALKQGWLLAKNHNAMKTRKYVMFEFLKTDGKTIRRALGTINPMFVPPTKGLRTPPPTTQVFFDVEKGEWRSYRKTNLLRIIL
jgi:hypothetical protein